MKPTGHDLHRYSLPLTAPLRLKGMVLHHREGLLLRLTDGDGSEGWGEASPLPGFSHEGLDGAERGLRDLAVRAMGREVTESDLGPDGPLAAELDRLSPAPSARFAFELALWNLYAASSRTPPAELASPVPRATVPLNALIPGSLPPEEAIRAARHALETGYETVKLKAGGRPVEEDVALVNGVYEELGDAAALRLDANRAWSFEEAAAFASGVAGLPIAYVEEPLADPGMLPSFARGHGLPVALDESLVGMGPGELGEHSYARAVVLKPTLLGGISPTLRLARRALDLGMTPVVSSAYETGVGTAALVALAAGIGDTEVPAGLDTHRQLAEDVVAPRPDLPARADVPAATRPREVLRDRLTRVG